MDTKILKVPFKKNEMMHFVWGGRDDVVYKENYEFVDDLKYIKCNGGRSSMTMIVQSINDRRHYYMFWKYFDECIRRSNNGPGPTFSGKWTFCKTGQNYSVKPVEEILCDTWAGKHE